MTIRGLAARLERLERLGRGGAVDYEAEAAEFGDLTFESDALRCYRAQRDGAGLLALVSASGALVYEVPGVDLTALT